MDVLVLGRLINFIFNLAILFCIPFSTDSVKSDPANAYLEQAICHPASFLIINYEESY